MATSTVENYLKTLYQQQQQRPAGKRVAMGKLAQAMAVAPGTATAMIKTLAESGLVDYAPRSGVRLTDRGQSLALHVLRRHRLVELFLVDVLGLDWSEVHDEAEELEHAISDKVLARMDAILGHPSTDPHGDPIPTAKGHVHHSDLKTLAESQPAVPLRIARVLHQQAEFLQFLDRHGLIPGQVLTIVQHDDVVDAITVQPQQGPPVTLGTAAACKILMEPADGPEGAAKSVR